MASLRAQAFDKKYPAGSTQVQFRKQTSPEYAKAARSVYASTGNSLKAHKAGQAAHNAGMAASKASASQGSSM